MASLALMPSPTRRLVMSQPTLLNLYYGMSLILHLVIYIYIAGGFNFEDFKVFLLNLVIFTWPRDSLP